MKLANLYSTVLSFKLLSVIFKSLVLFEIIFALVECMLFFFSPFGCDNVAVLNDDTNLNGWCFSFKLFVLQTSILCTLQMWVEQIIAK
jgi:hypothetical protein